jgi:hypothetical protein
MEELKAIDDRRLLSEARSEHADLLQRIARIETLLATLVEAQDRAGSGESKRTVRSVDRS